MLSMLLAYDAAGNVIATLDHLVVYEDGVAVGLADFAAHEDAGGKLRDVWEVDGAAGSATWPEWIGARAHEFRVELAGTRAAALVHRTSGLRRERAAVEGAIAARIAAAPGTVIDIRDLVGGPDQPLLLDVEGRTIGRSAPTSPALPVVGRDTRTDPSPPVDQPGADSPPPESSPQ